MSRSSLYCEECGRRLDLYVVGICSHCHYLLTGEDDNRIPPQMASEGHHSPPNAKDA